MSFNIHDFQGAINKTGYSKLAHFEGRVTTPPSMSANTRDLSLRILNMPLPGRVIRSSEFFMYGPEQKIATLANYADISMIILLSTDLKERDIILQWQDLIVGNYREEAAYTPSMFDHGYYDEYIGNLEIDIFDEAQKVKKTLRFEEAIPIAVGDITYDWSSQDFATLPVTWSYHRFYEKPLSTASEG